VFEKIDFFMVSMLLFGRQYGLLAKFFVKLPGDERSDAEIIEFLKSRTRRFADGVNEGVVVNA
jgi:hypothetical protein